MTDTRPSSRDNASREWFEDWFSHPLYIQVYRHRDSAEADRCVRTILASGERSTSDPDKISVLDIACGAGRHAIAFARAGYQVTANDLSAFLLETAMSEASAEELTIEFTRHDMRSIRLDRRFDLIVQLFSSFGYFETDAEDRMVLRKISDMLLPDGRYVLDLINPEYLKSNFIPWSERREGELVIMEERNLSENRVKKTITIRESDGKSCSFTESVRLFTLDEISALLAGEGFEIVSVIGSYDGQPYNAKNSPRLMLFARKKG
jgi:SAM-dependent methyltransferase